MSDRIDSWRGDVVRTAGIGGASKRPPRRYRTGPVTRGLQCATWAITALSVGTLAVRYTSLPQEVPTHFDISGRADQFGGRASLLWLALVWVSLQALLHWLSARPHLANYPVEVTDENAQALYREGERMLVWVGLAMAVIFSGILALVLTGIRGWSAVIACATIGLLAACAVGIGRMLR